MDTDKARCMILHGPQKLKHLNSNFPPSQDSCVTPTSGEVNLLNDFEGWHNGDDPARVESARRWGILWPTLFLSDQGYQHRLRLLIFAHRTTTVQYPLLNCCIAVETADDVHPFMIPLNTNFCRACCVLLQCGSVRHLPDFPDAECV